METGNELEAMPSQTKCSACKIIMPAKMGTVTNILEKFWEGRCIFGVRTVMNKKSSIFCDIIV
jgi:hypothetical protein